MGARLRTRGRQAIANRQAAKVFRTHKAEAVHGINPRLPHLSRAGVAMELEAEGVEEALPIEDAGDPLNVVLVALGGPHLADHGHEVSRVLRACARLGRHGSMGVRDKVIHKSCSIN